MTRESEQEILHQMYVAAERFTRMKSAIRVGGFALSTTAVLSLTARAFDYLQDPPLQNEQLAFVGVFGFQEWGWSFATCAVMISFGMFVFHVYPRSPWVLLGAHVLAIVTYSGYLVAIAQGILVTGVGWRGLAILVSAVVASAVRIGLLNGERDI